MTDNTDAKLISLIERIESLNEEKKDISKDIASVFAEAKEAGYDVRAAAAKAA